MNTPDPLEPFDVTLHDRASAEGGTRLGCRVRYVEGGPRDAPAVVLLHGLGRDHEQWRALASALSSVRRVVALDLPGFGASEPLRGPTTWEALAESVLDVIAGLEVGRATWIGHSIGAAAAIVAAADRPEFVERLVLVSPVCYRVPLPFDERALRTPVLGRSLGRRLLGRRVLARHVGGETRPASLPLTFRMLEESTAPSTIEARIPRVRAPALVVWGREDEVSPWTHGTRLSRELGSARLEILDCGHFPEAERPAHLQSLVFDFLGVTAESGIARSAPRAVR